MAVITNRRADVHIRWMIRRDMDQVQAIEDASYPFPRSAEDFTKCLRQRNCIGMVAEIGDTIAGYMVYELHQNRLEILNIAVRQEHRRQGVGASMLAKLYGKLSPQRRRRIDAVVSERNDPAHFWLKACGFRAVDLLRDHYDEVQEDAYLFRLTYRGDDQ